MTFALYFGNRGLFPGSLIASAKEELKEALTENGYSYLDIPEGKTRYGAVETPAEGRIYADFLREHRGEYDGIILSLPNFGDENGAEVALQDAGVPILIQAFPDEAGRMDPASRRDAFCGKLAMCNVLRQNGIPFSLTKQYTVRPSSPAFAEDLHKFAAVCRVVNGMRRFTIGEIGARTSAFKTIRFDELAFRKKGINVETVDLAAVYEKMRSVSSEKIKECKQQLAEYADFSGFSEERLETQARFFAAVKAMIEEGKMDAVGIRCWDELEKDLSIIPCVTMSLLGEMGIPSACESDMNNAVMMRAMSLAADNPTVLLDVNNNYGEDEQKCILFHCGVAPRSMMTERPVIGEHALFRTTIGPGKSIGVALGGLLTGDVTIGSIRTEEGKIFAFVGEGVSTDDPVEQEFFGIHMVMKKENLPEMLTHMSLNGYKHHCVIAKGHVADAVAEAFTRYLGYDLTLI